MNMWHRKDWKCGNCGKEYTSDEFIYSLGKVVVIEEEADPAYGIRNKGGRFYDSI